MQILIDSDIIINILKKDTDTIKKLKSLYIDKVKFFYSPIVTAEVFAGAYEREKAQIKELFSYLSCVELSCEIGEIAGSYANKYKKAYYKISLEDYMIAATAKKCNFKLWTKNKKHYPMKDIVLL